MHKITTLFCLLLFAFSTGSRNYAQDAPKTQEAAKALQTPVHYFQLEFVVQELDSEGKPVNSRSYSCMVSTEPSETRDSVRAGSRVPIPSGGGPTSYQYMDIGIDFDLRNTHELNGKLATVIVGNVSSLASPAGLSQPSTPVVRQNRWESPVLLPLNKATVVFRSDSLDSKGSMQLVMTATPIQ